MDGFDGFCPTRIEDQKARPLWPHYSFGRWAKEDAASWHRVLGDKRPTGILSVIGGSKPTEIPQATLDFWIARANADGLIVDWSGVLEDFATKLLELRRGYVKGSAIRIEGGSCDGLSGICNWFDERGVSVTLTFFGRPSIFYISDGGPVNVVRDEGAVSRTKSTKRRERDRVARARVGSL